MIALWSSSYQQQENSATVIRLSHQTVLNIHVVNQFVQTGSAIPGKPSRKERSVSTPEVVEFLEYCKASKPSTSTSEIQQALIQYCKWRLYRLQQIFPLAQRSVIF